jgi:hypothetical protein
MKVKNDFAMSIQPLFSRHVLTLRRCAHPAVDGRHKAAIAANLKELGYGG